jgi:hypothetical protein
VFFCFCVNRRALHACGAHSVQKSKTLVRRIGYTANRGKGPVRGQRKFLIHNRLSTDPALGATICQGAQTERGLQEVDLKARVQEFWA